MLDDARRLSLVETARRAMSEEPRWLGEGGHRLGRSADLGVVIRCELILTRGRKINRPTVASLFNVLAYDIRLSVSTGMAELDGKRRLGNVTHACGLSSNSRLGNVYVCACVLALFDIQHDGLAR